MFDYSDINVDALKKVYEEIAYFGEPLDRYYQIEHSGWGDTDEKQALRWLEDNEIIRPSLNFDDEKCDELERFLERNKE